MKRTIILAFLCLVAVTSRIYTEEAVVFEGRGGTYDIYTKNFEYQQFQIKYDAETERFYFFTKKLAGERAWIELTEKDLEDIRGTLSKFKEWEKIAIENQVTAKKELPGPSINGNVRWGYGDSLRRSNALTLSFAFFSQNENQHQLVISSNEVRDPGAIFFNDYILTPLYLESQEVDAFIDGIQKDKISAAIEEYNKEYNEKKEKEKEEAERKKEIDGLFQ